MYTCPFTVDDHPDSAQEIFDAVKAHLLAQGAKSMSEDGDTCAYRGAGGLACAAGCLIPDRLYSESMEGGAWDEIEGAIEEDEEFAAAEMLRRMYAGHEILICELQNAHDEIFVERESFALSIAAELRMVAARHGLTP